MDLQQIDYMVSQLRHDYGNLLQLVGAYLDMDMPEQARQFVHREIETWHREHAMLRRLSPEVKLYLWYQRTRMRAIGVELVYQDIALASCQLLERDDEPYVTLRQALGQHKPPPDGETALPVVYMAARDDGEGVEFWLRSGCFAPARRRLV
jgi:hypothetical protein